MRRLLSLSSLSLLALPLLFSAIACKPSGGGSDAATDAAPSASATDAGPDAPVDAAPEAGHGPVGFGPPTAGTPCRPGADINACSPDHTFKLSCAGGTWQAVQSCRGAGTCKGAGGGVTCDVGNPLIGDPCIPGSPPAHCANGNHGVDQCSGGQWHESVCMPPTSCKPNGNNGQAGCR
jgi:hypothetical protein